MEIQQKEMESLAAYIHHFKREAKGCNFTNSTAIIRIFIKGLRNVQILPAQVYEKGPQTHAAAISEVKKLQAAQQLTATLIPSSTLNIMSHEEDRCFQCQESGHRAQHSPNVCCFKCDEYGHIVVDCPYCIPPSGMPTCYHRPKSHTRHFTRSTSCHHHQDRYRHSRSTSQSDPCRYHSHSFHDSYRHHSKSHHRDNRFCHRITSQCPHSGIYCSHCNTLHHRSSPHRSSSAYSQDHSRSHSCSAYKTSKKALYKSLSLPSRPQGNWHDKRNPRVLIDDPQMDFYSSDGTSSDSKDD